MAAFALLLAATPSAGCSTVEFGSPSAEVRQQIQSSLVAVLPAVAEGPLEPAKDPGPGVSSRAARVAAAGSMTLGAEACAAFFGIAADFTLTTLICAATVPFGAVIAPFAALVGAAVGPAMAQPAAEVESAQQRLTAALGEADAAGSLRDRLVATAAGQGGVRLATTRAQRAGLGGAPEAGGGTILEIAFTDFGLNTLGEFEPDVMLEIGVRARLIRAADDHVLYWRIWRYLGPQRTYFDAAKKDAKVLRWDIRHGFERLADKIVFDLLIGTGPDVVFHDRQRPGTVETVAVSGS